MVAKPRATRRQIGELAFILRTLLDEYEAAGLRRIAGHRAALDLADVCARGQTASDTALAEARAGIAAERARYGKSSAGLYWQFCALPVDALLRMVERGDDESTHILTYARQSVPNANSVAGAKRVEALQHEAAALTLDATPLGSKTPTRPDSSMTVTVVDGLVAERDRTLTTDRATLRARLEALDLPATEPILAFEEAFGGLLLPVSRVDHWREDKAFTQVGVWAASNSGHTAPNSRHVPVALGHQDDVYVMNEAGVVECHTLTDPPFPFGTSAELVTRLALAALTYASIDREGTAVFPPANRVAELAPAAGLKRLFADAISEWWSGPAGAIVVLRGQVWGLARTAEAAKLLSA